ncbi:MAG: glycosyltransferase family 4 protein [Thermoleophilaceae bacterium]
MRVCLVYDCLYPHTVGGAERWYRNLGERLAAEGHEVTYLTLRQWRRGVDPGVPGVRVVTAGPRMKLYAPGGRRRILPPLVFGIGVLAHLLLRGRRYDVVHTASFPYFSMLAAAVARRPGGYRLVADWHELWTREYWDEYLGRLGLPGWLVQRACVRVRHRAFCFSRLHAARLRAEGFRGEVEVLPGQFVEPRGGVAPGEPERQPLVVFAGRHIPEKRVPALVPAVVRARERLPELRCVIFGDGPEREDVLAAVASHGLSGMVDVPGFVEGSRVERALGKALCMVLPSRREGYGLVVLEAAARGTPSVVVADPDNAAVELVSDGENGVIACSATPEDLSAAIVRVHSGGAALRASTLAWFETNRARVSLEGSLAAVAERYGA